MTIGVGDLVRIDVCEWCPPAGSQGDEVRPCDRPEGCAFKERRGKLAIVVWADDLNECGYPYRVRCKMLADGWPTQDLGIDDVNEVDNPLAALAECAE